ncbi:response regulator transcription factor [Pseudacidovorax sp. RU35E]|uniref:response regulator transcription factor n=1 Tax=Pseudacidovorax sp. RU35E TaxID=1907403 RepID=UPI000954BBD7|nr:response regulator transcription factor [Pseudacidovorax sp. RU35E]SIR25137.1 two-component system, OmpR family, response regulator [Pseudacidovorax sp. RU35E]
MHILLAEDDALLADGLAAQLKGAGFAVEHAPNGAVAEYLLGRHRFDLAILDLGLPLLDGLSLLRNVRAEQPLLPIVVLTARDSLEDRVSGLQAGADDYVTKPFDFPELEARLHALLRRTRARGSGLQVGGMLLDRDNRRATVGGEAIELSGREWAMLELLAERAGEVVTKDEIVRAWMGDEGDSAAVGNAVEVYVHKLRRKLEKPGLVIRTVRGLGYLLESPAPAATAGVRG